MKWITKDGKKIDLYTYNDINHKRNILRMLKRNLEWMPEIPFPNLSNWDSDWVYAAEQSILHQWYSYDAERERIMHNIEWLTNNINKNS